MLSALSSIGSLEIFSKLGDWAIEIFRILAGKKDKRKEKDSTPPIIFSPTIIVNPMSPNHPFATSEPAPTPSTEPPKIILPEPPQGSEPSGEPSQGIVLPPHPSAQPSEPEFDTDEYLTQLLTEIYKKKRSDEEVQVGFGNTDELNQTGEQ